MLVSNRAARRSKGRTGKKRLERIVFNLGSGKVRHEVLEGRDHLVVPCVMITEGVHNGNNGPGLYRERDTARTEMAWDHMPIVVNHPKSGGARRASVLNTTKIGIVLNTKWDRIKKKLRTEAWLDYKLAKKVEPRILTRIENGEKVEVSTGLFTRREPQKGVWNGRKYTWVAKNQTPDHLAVLPDEEGACSIKDGGGLLQLNSKQQTRLVTILRRALREDKKQIKSLKDVARVLKGKTVTNKGRDMLSKKKKTRMVRELVQNSTTWTVKDKLALLKMPDQQFKKVYAQAFAAEGEDDDDPVVNAVNKTAKKAGFKTAKKKIVKNKDRGGDDDQVVFSEKDFLKKLPAQFREVYNQGKRSLNNRRKHLIGVITNNEANVFEKDWLRKQNIDLLEGIAVLAQNEEGADIEDEDDDDGMFRRGFRPNYAGNVGRAPSISKNRRGRDEDDEEEEGLDMPTLFPVKNRVKSAKKRRKVA